MLGAFLPLILGCFAYNYVDRDPRVGPDQSLS